MDRLTSEWANEASVKAERARQSISELGRALINLSAPMTAISTIALKIARDEQFRAYQAAIRKPSIRERLN